MPGISMCGVPSASVASLIPVIDADWDGPAEGPGLRRYRAVDQAPALTG